VTAALHTIHVRVNDAATGQPTPVRIRFTNPAGEYFAPLGRLTEFATDDNEDVGGNLLLDGKQYAYIDGTCEIDLPAGQLLVNIHKGPEYRPRFLEVTLKPGQLALRTTIERWTDLRREQWYSGDMRAHFLTPHAALLEAAAEDLAVVNLLVTMDWIKAWVRSEDGRSYPVVSNILAFSGQRPALEMPGHMVVVNTHNHHLSLGNLALLNCHRIVHPLFVGDAPSLSHRTLADWCDQCHRKGGLVVWAGLLATGVLEIGLGYGEMLADLILGKIDAVELDALATLNFYAEDHWYPFLKSGCRVPLVGASAKCSNAEVLGSWRTYARLQPGEEFTYQNWIEAVRAGRTFVTNGPILSFTVNGQDPGAVIDLPSLDQPVHIVAELRSLVPVDNLELILNGQVYRHVEVSGSPSSASLRLETKLPAAGWLALRCTGPLASPQTSARERFGAHTSPIYIQVGGQRPPPDGKSLAALLDHLDKLLVWVGQQSRGVNGHLRKRLVEILENARKLLAERGQI
jgi:hypothetical protein